MRYTELEGRMTRVVSVTKIRDSGFDPGLRTFEITPHGIEIGTAPEAALRRHMDGHEAFLRKPFRVPALLELIAAIFARERATRPRSSSPR